MKLNNNFNQHSSMAKNPKPSLLPHQLIHPNHGFSLYPFSIFNPVPPRSNTGFFNTNPFILPKPPQNPNFQTRIEPMKAAMDPEMDFPRKKRDGSKRKPRKDQTQMKVMITRSANNTNRALWSDSEDRLLVNYVSQFGQRRWSEVAKLLDRGGKQCRERWYNQLRPDIRKVRWSEEEDKTLIAAHKVVGNKWAKISKQYLPGRTENCIKNRWNATKRSCLSRLNPTLKKRKRNRSHGKKLYSLLEDYVMSVLTADPALAEDDVIIVESSGNLPATEDDTMSVIAAAAAPTDDDVIINSDANLPAMEDDDDSSQGSGDNNNGGEEGIFSCMDMDNIYMDDIVVEALAEDDVIIVESNGNLPATEDDTMSLIAAAPAPTDDDVIINSSQGSGYNNNNGGEEGIFSCMDMDSIDVEALLSFDDVIFVESNGNLPAMEDDTMSVIVAAPAPADDDVIVNRNGNLPLIAVAPAPSEDDVIINSNGNLPAMEDDGGSSQGSGDNNNGGEEGIFSCMDMDNIYMDDIDVLEALTEDDVIINNNGNLPLIAAAPAPPEDDVIINSNGNLPLIAAAPAPAEDDVIINSNGNFPAMEDDDGSSQGSGGNINGGEEGIFSCMDMGNIYMDDIDVEALLSFDLQEEMMVLSELFPSAEF